MRIPLISFCHYYLHVHALHPFGSVGLFISGLTVNHQAPVRRTNQQHKHSALSSQTPSPSRLGLPFEGDITGAVLTAGTRSIDGANEISPKRCEVRGCGEDVLWRFFSSFCLLSSSFASLRPPSTGWTIRAFSVLLVFEFDSLIPFYPLPLPLCTFLRKL